MAKKPEESNPFVTPSAPPVPVNPIADIADSALAIKDVLDQLAHTKPTEDLRREDIPKATEDTGGGVSRENVIAPLSQGRVVMYDAGHPDGPYTALCTFAHNATCGNFTYWTHEGHQSSIERVVYGEGKRRWQWPRRV